jgi:poly-gamma-glutamate synthesis protein (capsule biosynthesis protein)
MIGRGIDQVLRHSLDPVLYEEYMRSAEGYVELAEQAHGPIPRSVAPEYVWGDALEVLDSVALDCRIVNLETTLTTSPAAWPAKEVHYRAHPANVDVLLAARLDCCTLANNHALDWGTDGLLETLNTLGSADIAAAGAGRTLAEAEAPVVLGVPGSRVIVVALGSTTSGTFPEWSAGPDKAGLAVVDGWSTDACARIADRLAGVRQAGDVVVASVHWGSNWGYVVPGGQRRLAHALVDVAGVDVVFGHSSHHPRPVEIYRDRPILYGCGDFITDYEGIRGHEAFRNELVLAWFVGVNPATGGVVSLTMAPFQARRFRLERASVDDVAWLVDVLDRHSGPFGVGVELGVDGSLVATW